VIGDSLKIFSKTIAVTMIEIKRENQKLSMLKPAENIKETAARQHQRRGSRRASNYKLKPAWMQIGCSSFL
jgi:hypothetical protein